MKRIVLIFILVLTSLFLFAGELPEPGEITFSGYIKTHIKFEVKKLDTAPDSYDLLQELDLFPDGDGLDIGKWTLIFSNPSAENRVYYVKYDYEPLKSDITKDEIAFELIERINGVDDEKRTGDQTRIDLGETKLLEFNSIIAVRYTLDGAEDVRTAGAAGDYASDIIVTLLTQ